MSEQSPYQKRCAQAVAAGMSPSFLHMLSVGDATVDELVAICKHTDREDSGFTFGDSRFLPRCCAKPVGCNNITEACTFRDHRWKRRHVTDHPHPLDSLEAPA